MHRVADLLEAKKQEEIISIDPLKSVYEAIQLMNDKNVGSVLVQIDGYLVGILAERDFVRRSIMDYKMSNETKVSEVMTSEPITVTEEDTVVHCVALMKDKHVRHLPVVRAGKAIGMVSLRDVFLDVIHDKAND